MESLKTENWKPNQVSFEKIPLDNILFNCSFTFVASVPGDVEFAEKTEPKPKKHHSSKVSTISELSITHHWLYENNTV